MPFSQPASIFLPKSKCFQAKSFLAKGKDFHDNSPNASQSISVIFLPKSRSFQITSFPAKAKISINNYPEKVSCFFTQIKGLLVINPLHHPENIPQNIGNFLKHNGHSLYFPTQDLGEVKGFLNTDR